MEDTQNSLNEEIAKIKKEKLIQCLEIFQKDG